MVIHTLNGASGEVPANIVVVRLAFGVAADGQRTTPGRFTSDEYSRSLKMLGEALLPEAPQDRGPEHGKAGREVRRGATGCCHRQAVTTEPVCADAESG